jgi:DNA (cytosine-5)-methyltransferase 1
MVNGDPTPTSRDHKGRNQRDDATCLTGALLPTPQAADGTNGGPNQRGSSGDLMLPSAVHLLPTPAVNDMGAGKTVEAWDEWTARMKAAHGNGNWHGPSLHVEALRMLPTPTAADSRASGGDPSTSNVTPTDATVRGRTAWGDYAPAIARWENLTRPAPPPTEPTGRDGAARLSPAFVEWLMGLPAGWVTAVPGITRNQALKALGNGVVPQQAAAATRAWVCDMRAERAA